MRRLLVAGAETRTTRTQSLPTVKVSQFSRAYYSLIQNMVPLIQEMPNAPVTKAINSYSKTKIKLNKTSLS